MKKLPIGIQSFANLRNNDYLYVDKTKEIHRLITTGRPFFLSRPRRFGKSLLVSTLEEIFKGNKALFEGLYIYDHWDWTVQHPVIRLDFGGRAYRAIDELKLSLTSFVESTANSYQLSLTECTLPDKFRELIEKLHQSTGQQVVVLIDEYDKPITDHLADPELAGMNRIILHDFYQILKAADEHLRFIFLTGVSKFSKVSIFSGLNNLRDITMSDDYASICGYTQAELKSSFDPYIEEFAQVKKSTKQEVIEEIKRWYDGYSWNGTTFVYNPFSTLLLFTEKVIKDYWFATGTPTFLVNLIKERNDVKVLLEPMQIPDSGFDSFDIQSIDPKILLFQTGYLTIKSVSQSRFSDTLTYTLGMPNEEVHRALMTHLVASFASYPVSDTVPMRDRMLEQLLEGNPLAFERSMQEMFARIPYQLHIPREAYYHSLLLLWLDLLGFDVQAEVSTDKGRIDAVWTWDERVVIAEIKYADNESKDTQQCVSTDTLLEEALSQIRDRRYYERYTGNHRRIALLAIAFAGKEIACRMEELPVL
jgi:hypothetical protein